MINKTLTGTLSSEYDISYDIPCAINDTFFVESDIKFVCTTAAIQDLLSITINAGNISTYNLYVRVLDNISTPNIIKEQIIELTASNLSSGNITVDLPILDEFTHDDLIYSLSTDEIFKLFKKYYLSFRIYLKSSGLSNTSVILANDFVQDLNLVPNTFNSGPYEVEYETIDLIDPADGFTPAEIKTFLEKGNIAGSESFRVFYPKDTNNIQHPMFIFSHGAGLYQEDLDHLLSFLASYGYFGISIINNANDFVINNPISVTSFLIKLDHFKRNIDKIKNGKFLNKIDFTKINLSGQSRGGGLMYESIEMLNFKSGTYSLISDLDISIDDIKSYVPVCRSSYGFFIPDQSYSYSALSITSNPNENTITLYDHMKAKIPVLVLAGKYDGQSPSRTTINDSNLGFDRVERCNITDKSVIVDIIGDHNWFNCNYITSAKSEYRLLQQGSGAATFNLDQTDVLLNSTLYSRTMTSSCILLFLSVNNFNNNKIKKLRFSSLKKREQKSLNTKYPIEEIFFTKKDDILYFIDKFIGITHSYAGVTGFTFNSPSGFTYDLPIDSSAVSQCPANLQDNIFHIDKNAYAYSGIIFTDNDTFNGIQGLGDSGLFIPIENDISFGYTLQSPITLSDNNYLGLRGALKVIYPKNTGNTQNAHFKIKLIDSSNNNAILTSKVYTNGFRKPLLVDDVYYALVAQNYNTVPGIAWFRAGDFYLKNPDLDLSSIKEIQLDFGPSHGSTYAHIVFDEFVVYKEL